MIGNRPNRGMRLVDALWLLGLSWGKNRGVGKVTAHPGGGQANATRVPADAELVVIDAVATEDDSIMLPFAEAGSVLKIYNAGGAAADIYANNGVNRTTGTTDKIGTAANGTPTALAAGAAIELFCPVNGTWAAIT